MGEERDELLDHEYDGIKEYNNPLPRWWVWLFYGTIVFAVIYIPYNAFNFGPSSRELYEAEMKEATAMYSGQAPMAAAPGAPAAPGQPSAAGPRAPAMNLEGDAAAIAAGKGVFTASCLPCHGDKGQGVIGPNLTDNHWIHGNTYADVVNVIANGVPEKGMIPWKATLNPTKINQVAAFVLSLRGTNPPNPKPPQGQAYPQ